MTAQTRRPSRPARRRRPPGDTLTGLGAAVILLALLFGVPIALIAVFGLPLPHGMPSASLLTSRLAGSAVLKACSVVVWLAWLQFVWCVIAEVSAAVRNTGMPTRVPLAGGIQPLVHRLVTAALLLSAATATLAPALAAGQGASAAVRPALPAGAASAPAIPGQAFSPAKAAGPVTNGAAHPPGEVTAATLAREYRPGTDGLGVTGAGPGQVTLDAEQNGWARHTEKIYVVQPPVGRFHESLWEIAENHLGDGRRYREIFELNKDRLQPDGTKLTIASLIRPGWILRMPHDAYGPGIEVVKAKPPHQHHSPPPQQPSQQEQPSPQQHPGQHEHPGSPRQHPGSRRHHPPAARRPAAAQHTSTPATPAPRAAAPTPSPVTSPRHAASQRDTPGPAASHSASPRYPIELAAAGLLAAGALLALERRRRRQARRRPYGRKVVTPEPDAAWAELALRLGEDEASAQMLDAGLRYLGYALDAAGRVPPTVFAVHVGDENLDLWVSPASHDAPAPWYPVGDGQVWRLALIDAPRLDLGQVNAPAPYPGLVSIGTDATGRVLVDVEAARGVIAVTGPGELVADVLCAMATEFATSIWSDDIRLTVVGAGEDLAVFAPDRVYLAATLAEALTDLEAHADNMADALAASGAESVPAGRLQGEHPEAWVPHYLISLVPPSDTERERLRALTHNGHAAAAAYLVPGDMPGATWTWAVTPGGRLSAPELGLNVGAQLIPREQQAAMVELFETADDLEGATMAAPSQEQAPASHLIPDAEAAVEVTLLGPVSVRTSGAIEPGRLPLATEIVVYLATHPGGVHPNVLTAAIWPRGVTEEVRDAALARVEAWLGSDGIGRPHLAADASGRLRLGSGVKVDWQVFCTLIGQACGGPDEDRLAQALSLVTGPFLAGTERGRYAWIVTDGLEYEVAAWVGDAAHRLSELRLAGEDPVGAMEAARAGMRLVPDDELLWRDLLSAGYATGQEDQLRAAASEVWARASIDGSPPGMAPETEALMDELMPTWRWTLA
jgi:hypothetical protein